MADRESLKRSILNRANPTPGEADLTDQADSYVSGIADAPLFGANLVSLVFVLMIVAAKLRYG